jgi:hypothetical protein
MGAPVGNTNAGRGRQLRALINAAMSRADDKAGKPDGATLAELIDAYVFEALSDKDVRRDFLDRMYGKPAQAVTGGDEDDEPIKFERVIRLVKGLDAT